MARRLRGTVQIKDKGWDAIKVRAAGLRGAGVKVGILADEAQAAKQGAGDFGVADYAAANEFGTTNGRIPERSFLRAGIDENERQIRAVLTRVLDGVLSGATDVQRGLGVLGEFGRGVVVAKLNTGPFRPNAPATIAAKGSSKPLIDTGRLRRSIDYVVVGGKK